MGNIDLRFGPYRYAVPEHVARLSFPTGEGKAPRTFFIVLSTAYDAGIVGPEVNGIAVFDEDSRKIVLDEHERINSGYFGPDAAQLAEFERIKNLDWKAFTEFCRTNQRYRPGSIPDVSAEMPSEGRPPQPNNVIYKPEDKPGPECPYAFPLSTRREIVAFLSAHEGHSTNRYDFALSWNIKVYGADYTGMKSKDEYDLDPAFNERWNAFVEGDQVGSLFWDACENGIRQWVEDEYTIYPGEHQGDFKFMTVGRSNGHLVLTEMQGTKLVFDGKADFLTWLESEASDDQLVLLYRLVVNCDKDLASPDDAISEEYAFIRSQKEAEWKQEAEATPPATAAA